MDREDLIREIVVNLDSLSTTDLQYILDQIYDCQDSYVIWDEE